MSCIVCGNKLGKNATKFCSATCHQKSCYQSRVDKWKAGLLSGLKGEEVCGWVKRYLVEKHGNKCSIPECGWSKVNPTTGKVPIQVDHIDGNFRNNAEENLRLLCPNCHSLTSTFGSLNKGRGRSMGRVKKGL